MEGVRGLVGGLLCKDTNPIPESPTFITWSPKMPQFQISSDWELGFHICILDGTCIHSIVLATVSAREDWGFCLKLLGFIGATQVSVQLKRLMEGSSRTVCDNWTGAPGGFDRRGSQGGGGGSWLVSQATLGFSTGSLTAQESPQFPAHWMVGHPSGGGGGGAAVYVSVYIVLLEWDFRSKADAVGVMTKGEYQWQSDWRLEQIKDDEGEEAPLPPP